MNPVEDALIRRIDARRAIASGLQGRQRARSIFRGYWLEEHTLQELGEQHSLSRGRVRQVAFKALDRVRAKLKAVPLGASPADVVAGFDRAAFLKHMRALIVRREQERVEAKEREWQREMEVMSHFIDMATPKTPSPPRPPPPPPPPLPSHHVWDLSPRPWRGSLPPETPLSYAKLCELLAILAQYALWELVQALPPVRMGLPHLGQQNTHCTFPRVGAHAPSLIASIVMELPPHSVISAAPLPMPPGIPGFAAFNQFAAVRILSMPEGNMCRFDITWDQA